MTTFFLVVFLWIFSVCLHEFAHAIVAYKGGDRSVKDKGYLSLNPMHYLDPFSSILIPTLVLIWVVSACQVQPFISTPVRCAPRLGKVLCRLQDLR